MWLNFLCLLSQGKRQRTILTKSLLFLAFFLLSSKRSRTFLILTLSVYKRIVLGYLTPVNSLIKSETEYFDVDTSSVKQKCYILTFNPGKHAIPK